MIYIVGAFLAKLIRKEIRISKKCPGLIRKTKQYNNKKGISKRNYAEF